VKKRTALQKLPLVYRGRVGGREGEESGRGGRGREEEKGEGGGGEGEDRMRPLCTCRWRKKSQCPSLISYTNWARALTFQNFNIFFICLHAQAAALGEVAAAARVIGRNSEKSAPWPDLMMMILDTN
jgi:hypothetical protein